MIKTLVFSSLILSASLCASAQSPVAYRLFDNRGQEVSFTQMTDSLSRADVVFIGENHNCPIAHWMEYKITEDLHGRRGPSLVLGEEMMEADNQLILDEYMQRLISYDRFEAEARLWPNYSTDYYPVILYAKEHSIPFVATNVPRRYANAVSQEGLACLDSLSDEAKRFIAPLPITFSYDSATDDRFAAMQMLSRRSPEEMRRLSEAQALKDATMAWFISRNLPKNGLFLHINGSMHSNSREGIIPYLLEYAPGLNIATVTSLRLDDPADLTDYLGLADFYIVVPEDFPTSY